MDTRICSYTFENCMLESVASTTQQRICNLFEMLWLVARFSLEIASKFSTDFSNTPRTKCLNSTCMFASVVLSSSNSDNAREIAQYTIWFLAREFAKVPTYWPSGVLCTWRQKLIDLVVLHWWYFFAPFLRSNMYLLTVFRAMFTKQKWLRSSSFCTAATERRQSTIGDTHKCTSRPFLEGNRKYRSV